MKTPRFFRHLFFLIFFILFAVFSSLAQEVTEPYPYGGKRLTEQFIHEEMIYPNRALGSGTEGTVKISALIRKDGSVDNIRAIEKVAKDIDDEAIRIFKKIRWYPATRLGKPIDFELTYTIQFKIRKYKKFIKERGYEFYAYPHEPVDKSIKIYPRGKVEQMARPIFNSFDRDLNAFISKNLKYPEAAFKATVSGTVRLEFVVEPSGRMSNIVTVQSVGAGCNEEAIRILRMIKWYPALVGNLAVRSEMFLTITFDISKKTVKGGIPEPGEY